jgi:predicted glycosyltransferase
MTAPRILAYCAAIFGLGHERPTLAVLAELAGRVPEAQMLLISGTPPRLANRQPRGLDVLTLPSAKRHGKPGGLRAAVLEAAIASYQPDLIYVDEEPAGHAGELMPALEAIESMPVRPTLVVGMRDILNEGRFARSYARSHGHDTAQARFYDRTLVFGDPSVFDPVAEYGWTAPVAARTTMCGYMRMTERLQPAAKVRAGLGIGEQPLMAGSCWKPRSRPWPGPGCSTWPRCWSPDRSASGSCRACGRGPGPAPASRSNRSATTCPATSPPPTWWWPWPG